MKKFRTIILTLMFMLVFSIPALAMAPSTPNASTPKRTHMLAIANLSNGMDLRAELIFTQAEVLVDELIINGVEYKLPIDDLYISPSMNTAYLNTFVEGIGLIDLTWHVKDLEVIRENRTNHGIEPVGVEHTIFSSYVDGTPVSGTVNNTSVTGSGFCFIGFFVH